MQAKVYNQEGKEAGNVKLPESVFDAPWNPDLVHQVVISMQANARTPVAHTHDRSEQRGGGKKPWRQKGTGRARHGSRRSPIWRGGGVTFGPRNDKDYSKKINKKMRTKALYSVLSQKLRDNEILFVDSLSFNEPKTKDAQSIVNAFGGVKGYEGFVTKKRNIALITLLGKSDEVEKSFRNLGGLTTNEVRNLNPVDVLSYKYLVITDPDSSVSFFESKAGVEKKAPKSKVKSVLKTEKKAPAPKVKTKPKAKVEEKTKTKVKTKTK